MGEKDWNIHLYATLACQIKRKDFKTTLVIALEGDILELVFLTPWDLEQEFNHSGFPDLA